AAQVLIPLQAGVLLQELLGPFVKDVPLLAIDNLSNQAVLAAPAQRGSDGIAQSAANAAGAISMDDLEHLDPFFLRLRDDGVESTARLFHGGSVGLDVDH